MRRQGPAAALALVLGLLVAVAPAGAKKLPSYNSPGYTGTRHVGPLRAPAPPKPTTLASKGTFPDVYVDAAGTSHIVWAEDDPVGADPLRYCRLKRGAHRCDNPPATQRLVPQNTYGPGDGPQFNNDYGGPAVVASGGQLILLTHRYPTVYDKPNGASSSTTLAWVSDDGGNSFSGPAIVGHVNMVGGAVAFGPDTDPTIVTIGGENGLCGLCVQGIHAGSYTSSEAYLGNEGANRNYSPTLAIDKGLPVAAFADLKARSYVRRYTGSGDVGDVANWTPSFSLPGDDPDLAGGPKGLFIATHAASGGSFSVRKLATSAAGAAHRATDAEDSAFAQLFEDPAGRLVTAWSNTGPDKSAGLKMRTSLDGASWGNPAETLLSGGDNGQIALGATTDGGGIVVANHTGGVNGPGKIQAVGIGTLAKNGKQGLGHIPGTGDPSVKSGCQTIDFGSIDVKGTEGCFFHGTGAQADVDVTGGEIDLNGLKIVPDKQVKILLDPHKHTLNTTGGVRVLLRAPGAGEIELWHGELHANIGTDTGATLFSFDTSRFAAILKGFPIKGTIDVMLTKGGVRIPVSLKLPPYLGDVSGQAVLLADKSTGLHLDSLKIDVPDAPLGPIEIKKLHIGYTATGNIWEGNATFILPPQPGGPTLEAGIRFNDGRFTHGEFKLTPPFPPGIPIGPGVFLSGVGGSVDLEPALKVGLTADFGAIPLTPTGPFTATVTGTATLDFGTPVTFTFVGSGQLLDKVALGSEKLVVTSDGLVTFNSKFTLDLDIISASGGIDGFVDGPKKQFGAELHGNVELAGKNFAGVDIVASSLGLGGCYDLGPFGFGFGYHWGDVVPSVLFPDCDLSEYRLVPGSAPPPGQPPPINGSTFVVKAGTPSVSLRIKGNGGPPSVSLVDPKGNAIIPSTPEFDSPIGGGAYAVQTGPDEVVIGISKPRAGTWRINGGTAARRAIAARAGGTIHSVRAYAAADSASIARVDLATGLSAPKVTGRLGGKGRKRTLAYTATRRTGLTTTFFERGRLGTRILGKATKAKGTLKFGTGTGPKGRRTVYALIESHGMPRLRKKLGSYTAPAPPRPGRPAHVRVKRTRTGASVTWSRVAGVHSYVIRVHVGDGRRIARIVSAKTRRLAVARVAKRYAVTAGVVGRTRSGLAGRSRSGRLAAVKAKHKKAKKKTRKK